MGVEINTKKILKKWESDIKDRAFRLHLEPRFTIIQVGHRNDSNLYVNNKIKKAKELGIDTRLISLDNVTPQRKLNQIMQEMTGPTILQLPLPDHLNASEALSNLRPEYDLDGLTTYQKGLLVDGDPKAMVPATAKGVIKIAKSLTDLEGLQVLIISRSELIGKPLVHLVLQEDAVPMIAHSKVSKERLYSKMKRADIIVTGCGKRKIFNSEHVGKGEQIIIDCSMEKINGLDNVGDMDKEDILSNTNCHIASGYGHTGPATVLGLLDNVVQFYEMR